MSKIKKQTVKPKISSESINESKCPPNPSFSFEHLTLNDSFNFNFFSKAKTEMLMAKAALHDRLQEICMHSWLHWYGQSKNVGIETLKSEQIDFDPNGYVLSKDAKVIIFRFKCGNKSYRILGIKKSPCSTYYIIGFDFNFTAYDHGS